MNELMSLYNLKVIGTIYENQEELEVEFIPDILIKEEFEIELKLLVDKYESGILVN